MANVACGVDEKRSWQACLGSVFELKWRFDDEMIASGGSDYNVRVWSTETGVSVDGKA